ncbi:unnamed protein product [Arabidopsis arenosa]|uniref:Ubiquitin-like protease family profile domain-containing protein n=1 Tax=Arabidopsis arenosa TaxID=38785 RepID=A0A8S1ZJ17_ARAAE|nr:unnamed protein product [Arabidopsis arenosa]
MEEEPLPKRMFCTGFEPSGRHRVNNYFNLRWIENIKQALSDADNERLCNSQFGSLMLTGNHTFSVMFVHYLLSRQLVTNKKYELWWVFAGKPIRYAIEDFALVTGLNCGKTGFKPDRGRGIAVRRGAHLKTALWKSLFGNLAKPTTTWILEKLLLGKKYKDDETRFRLALLLLVDGILCPTCAKTNISPKHVAMVGDIEVFLKYPWGRESFLKTVVSAKARTARQLVNETCAIQGFSHALVVVTVACCPMIIRSPSVGLNIHDPAVPIRDIVQNVIERSLCINVHNARMVDQTGQARVTSILNEENQEEVLDLSFSDEEDDEEVTHLVQLVHDDHPFEHNTWTGGRDAAAIEAEPSEPVMTEVDGEDVYVSVHALIKETTDAVEERYLRLHHIDKMEMKGYIDSAMSDLKKDIAVLIEASGCECKKRMPIEETEPEGFEVPQTGAVGDKEPGSAGSSKSRKKPSQSSVTRSKSKTNKKPRVGGSVTQLPRPEKEPRKKVVEEEAGDAEMSGLEEIAPPTFSVGLTQQAVGGPMLAEENEPAAVYSTKSPAELDAPTFSLGLTQEGVAMRTNKSTGKRKAGVGNPQLPSRHSLRVRDSITKICVDATPIGQGRNKRHRSGKEDDCVDVTRTREIPTAMLFTGDFDPFTPPSKVKVQAFLKQMERSTSYAVAGGMVVDNIEFLQIYEATAFLDESSADMLVKFIQLRRDRTPMLRFDFLPSTFVSELYRQYNRFVRSPDRKMFSFSNVSIAPFITRPKWMHEVDVVYIPMQVERQHWIGLVIDLKTWKLLVLDCNRGRLSDQQISQYLEHLSIMLPYLLARHGINEAAHNPRLDPMSILRPTIPFHCSALGLVGIASIVLLELHAVSSLQTYYRELDDEKIQIAAKQYAIEAFGAFSPTPIAL